MAQLKEQIDSIKCELNILKGIQCSGENLFCFFLGRWNEMRTSILFFKLSKLQQQPRYHDFVSSIWSSFKSPESYVSCNHLSYFWKLWKDTLCTRGEGQSFIYSHTNTIGLHLRGRVTAPCPNAVIVPSITGCSLSVNTLVLKPPQGRPEWLWHTAIWPDGQLRGQSQRGRSQLPWHISHKHIYSASWSHYN